MQNSIFLLLDSNRGIYIPQQFAKHCNPENSYWVYSLEDAAILREGPDNEFYWETWETVLNNAVYIENGVSKYYLTQEDDLWAVPCGYYLNENLELMKD